MEGYMSFQSIVDGIGAMACIVSVEDLGDGRSGKYRIVTGNNSYIDSIEKPSPGAEMLTDKFTPNTEYTDYLTRDLNFEDYCYRAAVGGKCLHSYVHPDRLPLWFNMMFLPIVPEDGEIIPDGYEGALKFCIYIMEINFEANSESMSDIDGAMASAVLNTCIKLRGTTDFKETMKDVVKDIRDICEAEHCCILTMDDYSRTCEVLCEAFEPGSKLLPMENYLDGFYDIAESWEDTIAGSNCLIAKNEQDMEVIKERNPIWFESLTAAGVKNIVLFPLKSREQLLGYMWALNYNAELAVKIKETLELSTFILGSELGNYLLLDRLKILSSKDMLTGVMNRNEMNNYVDELCTESGESAGVIFADLNGLKRVNDTDGHPAGDKLLKDAANALREVFDESQIFRAGGDEFSIIVTGITQEELDKKIFEVKNVAKNYDKVSFAIGGHVVPDHKNVRTALRKADEKMYEDKRKFYEQFPEDRRV